MVIFGDRHDLHIGCDIRQQRISQSPWTFGHVVRGYRERMCEPLAFDWLNAILPFASQHDAVFEEPLDSIRRLESVQVDRAMCPLAFQTKISPALNVGVAAFTGLGVDGIELRKRKPLDGVVLIDEDDGGSCLAERA